VRQQVRTEAASRFGVAIMNDSPSSAPSASRAPRRRWLRFSLRTLLLAAPLAAILISFVGVRWYRSYVETQAVRAIQRYGGTIQRDKEGQIVLVEVPGDQLTDEALAELIPHLANLPTLETLILHGPFLTDEGLAPLVRLTQLKHLHLINTEVSAGALASLQKGRPDLEIAQSSRSPTASALVARDIFDHALLHLAFSPDQRLLVTGRANGRLEFWELSTGKIVWSVQAHDEWLFSLAYHPRQHILATAGGDNVVRLWDLAARKKVAELVGHDDDVHSVVFTPDGTRLVTASDDHTLRIWDAERLTTLHVLTGHTDTIPALAISPDGRRIASASRDDTIRLWDIATGQLLAILEGHEGDVMSVAFSPDGSRLASGSYDKTIRIWDMRSCHCIRVITGPEDLVFAVRFSPDGRQLAAGSGDGVRLWNLDRPQPVHTWSDARLVSALAFDKHGSHLAATSAEGAVHVWNVETGLPLATLGRGYRAAKQSSRVAEMARP
jgi:WD40 repeat protein